MNGIKMQFKDYVFSHNPSKFEIINDRRLTQYISPLVCDVVQDLGLRARIVKGSGEFFGTDCMEQFMKLYSLYRKSGSGKLILPTGTNFYAYFKELELVGEAGPFSIKYSFCFLEDTMRKDEVKSSSNQFHRVAEGETAWHIAALYKTDINTLLALNPSISSPNHINAGDVIRVR